MAFNGLKVIYSRLDTRIAYILDPTKTQDGLYTGGVNTTPPSAYRDMQQTKQRYGKEDGRLGYHAIQSFAPGEITPAEAIQIGRELIQRYLHRHYEVVYAVHTDHDHVHLHMIWNSVSFVDGRKYHAPPGTYLDEIRRQSDAICRERGYSVIRQDEKARGQHYAAWKAEQAGQLTLRDQIRQDMDAAIRASVTWNGFIREMQGMGYLFKTQAKHPAAKAPGHPRYVRLKSLGPRYMPEAIKERILRNQHRQHVPKALPPKKRRTVFRGSFTLYKVTWSSIRALYYYYLNILRKAQNKRSEENLRRESLLQLQRDRLRYDALYARFQFLNRHDLNSPAQVQAHMEQMQAKIAPLLQKRERLYAKRRRAKTPEEEATATKTIQELNATITTCRKEEKLCKGILREAPALAKVVKKVREPIRREEKEREIYKERHR